MGQIVHAHPHVLSQRLYLLEDEVADIIFLSGKRSLVDYFLFFKVAYHFCKVSLLIVQLFVCCSHYLLILLMLHHSFLVQCMHVHECHSMILLNCALPLQVLLST